MPKRAVTSREPLITLDHASRVPLHRQVYERIRLAILNGQLHPGQRLPASRTLASQLAVSRNTISNSYEQLLAEGYLESQVGSGTVVARTLPETLLKVPAPPRLKRPSSQEAVSSPPLALSRLGRAVSNQKLVLPEFVSHPDTLSQSLPFRGGVPALELFPYKLWAQLVARHARQSLPAVANYQPSTGYAPLREAIAAHIGVARGVRCQPEQVIIVSGSQGGLDLAARLLLDPGDFVWMENPGYFGARYALENAGARLVPVPVDREGLDVAAGQRQCSQARLAFVTPSHQFPAGVTMSLARRLALLQWAGEANAWILEDDYDSEFRFGGRPLEALQGLDRANRVIYIGTFSKVLFPALRLGYLVVPPQLVDTFIAARRFVDVHPPVLEQLALTDFITEGHFVRHIRRMRALYLARRNTLVAAIKRELGDWLEVYPPEAGMHLVGWLPPGIDDNYAAQLAARQGIETMPVSRLSLQPLSRGGLVLSYAAVEEPAIEAGVRQLAKAFQTLILTRNLSR